MPSQVGTMDGRDPTAGGDEGRMDPTAGGEHQRHTKAVTNRPPYCAYVIF